MCAEGYVMGNLLKRRCGCEIAMNTMYHFDYFNSQGKPTRNTTRWPFLHNQKPLKKVVFKFHRIRISGSKESDNAVSGH